MALLDALGLDVGREAVRRLLPSTSTPAPAGAVPPTPDDLLSAQDADALIAELQAEVRRVEAAESVLCAAAGAVGFGVGFFATRRANR